LKIESTVLDNGVTILGINLPDSKSVVTNFGLRTGSRNEDLKYWGISHFLEHMVFKGTKKRPTAEAIAKEADRIGAVFNAATEKEWTYYYIHSASSKFELALDIVGELVTEPLLDQSELEKEVGTIIEELKMYNDTPMMNIGWKMEETMFGEGTVLGRDEGGVPESVSRINAQIMRRYYEHYYRGGNCVVAVAGKLPADYVKMISQYTNRLKSGRTDYAELSELSDEKIRLLNKETEQAHLGVCFPEESVNAPTRYASRVMAALLGGYMSSRLFTEIREKRGLAYYVSARSNKYTDTGVFAINSGVKISKIEEAVKIIREVVLNLAETLTDEEVERAKGYLSGAYAIRFDDPEARASQAILQELLTASPETPEEIIKGVASVTTDEVRALAQKIFRPDKMYLTIIGPFTDREKFAKILDRKG